MTEERARYLVDNDFAFITISIDSATKDVHDKIRGSGFDNVVENIKYLQNYKYEQGKRWPKLYMDATLMKWNLLDAEDIVKLAWSLDAERIFLHPMNGLSDWRIERNGIVFDYQKQMIENFPMAYDEAMVKAIKTGEVLGDIEIKYFGLNDKNNLNREVEIDVVDLKKTVPSSRSFKGKNLNYYDQGEMDVSYSACSFPWEFTSILTDGKVRHCCFQSEYLGSLEDNSFDEIWFGEESQKVREDFQNQKMPHACIGDNKNICFVRTRSKERNNYER